MDYNISEDSEVQLLISKANIRRERELAELKKVLEHPGARWFVWRLLSYCGVFKTMSGVDPHSMAILSGKRDAGLWVLDELFSADNKVFQVMQAEAQAREELDNGD